jgi:hypothetical protein
LNFTATRASVLHINLVVRLLKEAIGESLPDTERQLSILRIHTTKPYPGLLADLRERWEWTKEAKRNQNRAKHQELTLVADLMATYPDQLIVKKSTDPAQAARQNLKHIEFGFRKRATRTLQNRQIKPLYLPKRCDYRPGVDNIELIPYDRHLRFFLDVLKEHPVGNEAAKKDELEKAMSTVAIASNFATGTQNHKYPSTILTDIQTVLDGLAFVYTGPTQQPIVERIK